MLFYRPKVLIALHLTVMCGDFFQIKSCATVKSHRIFFFFVTCSVEAEASLWFIEPIIIEKVPFSR